MAIADSLKSLREIDFADLTLDNVGGSGLPARVAVTDGRLKLIVNVSEQLLDVFDIERDPREFHNLGGQRSVPGRAALDEALVRWEDLGDCVAH